MKDRNRILCLLALAVLLALPALAADTETEGAEGPDMEAMMAAWQEAAAPGEHHRFLAGLEGDWAFESTVWMDPSQPPMTSTGTSKKAMIFGGRYLQEDVTGDMMGTPFKGRGITGYDNTAGELVGTWMDDMSTSIAVFHGSRDGNTVNMHGEYLDPMSKQTVKARYVTRVLDADHHVFEYYMTMPGAPEMKSMEIAYSRKGAE